MWLYAKCDAHAMPRKDNNKNPLSLDRPAKQREYVQKQKQNQNQNEKQANPTYKAVSN